MPEQNKETRTRVLAVAARLFAAGGFKKVTVRHICREAGANVAAVNYHFGDKLGLYREVLVKAIETMRGTTQAAREAGDGQLPEQKLRSYVRVVLQRIAGRRHDTWIHQLMQQEMADPTPALDLVIDQVVLPRMAYLSEVVADILKVPVDDELVKRSVISVQAQCHAVMGNPVSRRLIPDFTSDDLAIEKIASHIAEFSLGGIRSIKHASPPARSTVRRS